MNGEEVSAAVVHTVAMLAEMTEQFSLMGIGQVLMLEENCRRPLGGEIDRFQHLEIVPFGVDMKQMHLPNSVLLENIGEGTHLDRTFDNERGQRAIQVLHDEIPAERPESEGPRWPAGDAVNRFWVNIVKGGIPGFRANRNLLQDVFLPVGKVFAQAIEENWQRLDKQPPPFTASEQNI